MTVPCMERTKMSNTRIERQDMLMRMAEAAAMRGTCSRLRVGAVIVKEGRVLSTGYNGNVSNMRHCNHSQSDSACTTAVHAEANAILWAARTGSATEEAMIYTTHQPCLDCAKLIINAGIIGVVFQHEYRIKDGLSFLLQMQQPVFRMKEDRSLYQVTRL